MQLLTPPFARHFSVMTKGERIREARTNLGVSQAQLADQVGVDKSTVYRWETGRASPRPADLKRLARALGVGESWIKTGKTAEAVGAPPFWLEFTQKYEHLDQLTEAELSAMQNFAGRTHRIRSWYDWVQLAEWLRNRQPLRE